MSQATKTIRDFSTSKTGYGHWLITMKIENPALTYSDDDYYFTTTKSGSKEGEPDFITIKHTTTNSRAIDGHDGYEQALAGECFRANEIESDDYDMSNLRSEEED